MTTATRGDSAPLARPADRPFSESQQAPVRPAPPQPTLTDCCEIDEQTCVATLPPCLRSRVAQPGSQGGER